MNGTVGTPGVDLAGLLAFARIVECGGVSAAAAALRLPKSTISRRMAALESALGTRLVERTTRATRVTEVGRLYYAHSRRVLESVDAATAAVQNVQAHPRGTVRLTAPVILGRILLGPLVAEFLEAHPDVRLHVDVTNRRVDLVEEGYDVALRVGPLPDSTLVARRLGAFGGALYASPRFLAQHPIRRPSQLGRLPFLALPRGDGGTVELHAGGRTARIPVSPVLEANDVDVVRAAATRGLGVCALPDLIGRDAVARGELAAVLPAWQTAPVPLHALHAGHKSLSPAIRAFIDRAVAYFGRPPGPGAEASIGRAAPAAPPGRSSGRRGR